MVSFLIDTPENKTAKLINKINSDKNDIALQCIDLRNEYRRCKRKLNFTRAIKIQSELRAKIENYYALSGLMDFALETLT